MSEIKVKNNAGFKSELVRHIKMMMGQGVVIGRTYTGVSVSGGKTYEGCFVAATYDKGILALESEDKGMQLQVGGDIGSFMNRIYADDVKSIFINV